MNQSKYRSVECHHNVCLSKIRNQSLDLQDRIFQWWGENKRDLPWRQTIVPYHIMISEVMLQQTQVNRVIPKYLEFIDAFPTLESLASGSNIELLKLWSGLGYNRRVIWLKDAAQEILQIGLFPKDPKDLIKLKGIGKYTSNSIPIFAFNADYIAVDTNIRKIFEAEGLVASDASEVDVYQVAKALLPKGRSRDWHNALMDYGSTLFSKRRATKKTSTKFQGSNRQIRGKIIKRLTTGDKLTIVEIENLVKNHEIVDLLNNLVSDGLIQYESNLYFI